MRERLLWNSLESVFRNGVVPKPASVIFFTARAETVCMINDPTLFDEKPPAKKKKVSAETIADGQAWVFARKLAYHHPFGSRFAKAGEEYDEFINRIAEDMKKPDRFEAFRPYMVKLNLIDEENEHDNATPA